MDPQQIMVEEPEPLISLYAVTAESTFQTLKAVSMLGKQPLLILVDSGSSHNFLDSDLAARLQCRTHEVKPFQVCMVDGNKVVGTKVCKGFTWTMQGEQFKTNTLILPLQEYDLILGVQWLRPLALISWDFQKGYMQFSWNGHNFKLLDMEPKPQFKWLMLD